MPSQPDETTDQDLAHIRQYAQLAYDAIRALPHDPQSTPWRAILSAEAEAELLGFLRAINDRARAAGEKLAGPRVPLAYLTGEGPAKMLRFYWCLDCGVNHWEDDRAKYDDHILHAGRIEYGHRTVELVR